MANNLNRHVSEETKMTNKYRNITSQNWSQTKIVVKITPTTTGMVIMTISDKGWYVCRDTGAHTL